MDEALVEHAEHDVHRGDGGGDEQQFVRERRAERRRGALIGHDEALGQPMSFLACSIASIASPSEAFGARLNEIVVAGN